ncbi:MAG TPA: endonuclease/exonuclease/phosphatase family protein, partial [Candidatus Saccharimonadales bacterium]
GFPEPAKTCEDIAARVAGLFESDPQLAWVNLQEVTERPPHGAPIIERLGQYGLKYIAISEPTDTVPDTTEPLRMVTITRHEPLTVSKIEYGEHFTDGKGYEHWGRLLEVTVPIGANDTVTTANAHALYMRPATMRARRHRWHALREVLGEPERMQRHVLNGDLNTPKFGLELQRTCAALGRRAITGGLRDTTWKWCQSRWIRLNLDHMLLTKDLEPLRVPQGHTLHHHRQLSDHTALRGSFRPLHPAVNALMLRR